MKPKKKLKINLKKKPRQPGFPFIMAPWHYDSCISFTKKKKTVRKMRALAMNHTEKERGYREIENNKTKTVR